MSKQKQSKRNLELAFALTNTDDSSSTNQHNNAVVVVPGDNNNNGGCDSHNDVDDDDDDDDNDNNIIVSNTDQNIVEFDVGGRIFKVRRSLLDSFPETMLARSATNLWSTSTTTTTTTSAPVARAAATTAAAAAAATESSVSTLENKNKKGRIGHTPPLSQRRQPIFMDRDSHRFSYILDYMRDGCVVVLPVTISKESFLKELQYFGFDEASIHNDSITCTVPTYDAVMQIDLLHTKFSNRMQQIDLERSYTVLSYACFCEFVCNRTVTCIFRSYGSELQLPSMQLVMQKNKVLSRTSASDLLVSAKALAKEYEKDKQQKCNSSNNNTNNTVSTGTRRNSLDSLHHDHGSGHRGSNHPQTTTTTTTTTDGIAASTATVLSSSSTNSNNNNILLFNTCLSEYGLRCTFMEYDSSSYSFTFHLKPKE